MRFTLLALVRIRRRRVRISGWWLVIRRIRISGGRWVLLVMRCRLFVLWVFRMMLGRVLTIMLDGV